MPVRTTQELIDRMRPTGVQNADGLFNPASKLADTRNNVRAILEFEESHTLPMNYHPTPAVKIQWQSVRRGALSYTHFARKAQFWLLVPFGAGNYIYYSKEALLQYEIIFNELLELIRLIDPKMQGPLVDAL